MPTFKRVALVGSEDLFRPTRPEVVTDTDDVIKGTVDRPGKAVKEVVYKTLNFTLVQEQLTWSYWIVIETVRLLVLINVGMQQENLARLDISIGIFEIGLAIPERFDFCAL